MRVRILGSGTSSGVPRIGNDWGVCDPAEPRNRRLRSSILVEHGETRILVDTSPDMRERRAAHWARTLEQDLEVVTVAEQGGQAVAFAGAGATRLHAAVPGDYDAELYTLYALKAMHGQGLGRRLVQESAARLHAQGFGGLAVWVLDVNPTRAFYRHLGASELGHKTEEIPGGTLTEVALGWPDLTALLPG